jgi:hypothetical protein
MNIFKQKELYTNTILTFLVIVLIDWFIEAGFKLFRGYTFSQTLENYKVPFTYIGVVLQLSISI